MAKPPRTPKSRKTSWERREIVTRELGMDLTEDVLTHKEVESLLHSHRTGRRVTDIDIISTLQRAKKVYDRGQPRELIAKLYWAKTHLALLDRLHYNPATKTGLYRALGRRMDIHRLQAKAILQKPITVKELIEVFESCIRYAELERGKRNVRFEIEIRNHTRAMKSLHAESIYYSRHSMKSEKKQW